MNWKYPFCICFLVAVSTTAAVLNPHHPPQPAGISAADTYRKLHAATVRVNLPDGGHGSGFCRKLSDDSVWVWTCSHVTTHCRVPQIPTDGGEPTQFVYRTMKVTSPVFGADDEIRGHSEWTATLVRASVNPDVALLRLSQGGDRVGGFLDFADKTPKFGSPLLVSGSPRGLDATISRGVFVLPSRRTPGGYLDQIDAPALGGNSGGPVVNSESQVVGLLCAGYGETFTCMVPARVIREWAVSEGLLFAFEGTTPPEHPPAGPPDAFTPPPAP